MVVDQDFVIGLLKLKMAERMWPLKTLRKLRFDGKLVYTGIRGR